MADLWELSRYVEAHPEDYPQRWRLAKKCYLDREYRLALEHLQVLKNEWKPKLSMRRYLAAVYFRMGRYEESIAELAEAIDLWPEELALRVQRAHMFEAAARKEEALAAWEGVRRLSPDHRGAQVALQRLRKEKPAPAPKSPEAPPAGSSDEFAPGAVCPVCGARNSDEFQKCWQCHAPLDGAGLDSETWMHPASEAQSGPNALALPDATAARVILPVATLLLILAAGLTVWMFYQAGSSPEQTVLDPLGNALRYTRSGTGLALLLLWPLILRLSLHLWGCWRADGPVPAYLGLALAAFTYALTWLPGNLTIPLFLFPALLSLFGCILLLPLPKLKLIAVWATQYACAVLVAFAAFAGLEWAQTGFLFNPLVEVPVLARYATDHATQDAGGWPAAQGAGPLKVNVRTSSCGSPWLDGRAEDVVIEVRAEGPLDGGKFELAETGSTRLFEPVTGESWRCVYRLSEALTYTLSLTGLEGKKSSIGIYSLKPLEKLPSDS